MGSTGVDTAVVEQCHEVARHREWVVAAIHGFQGPSRAGDAVGIRHIRQVIGIGEDPSIGIQRRQLGVDVGKRGVDLCEFSRGEVVRARLQQSYRIVDFGLGRVVVQGEVAYIVRERSVGRI